MTLPGVLDGVTGRGMWAALNAVTPVTLDDGMLVLGLPSTDVELAGHLRMASTQRLIEAVATKASGQPVRVRLIEGVTLEDYELAKRRDVERRRLQEAEMAKMRAEMVARTSWDTVYEQLSRRYAAMTQKSLPQNRARFFEEGVDLIAEARKSQETWDEHGERNFARCLERLSQYSELPTTLCAHFVLQRAGEL
jgi:hypothetical protein